MSLKVLHEHLVHGRSGLRRGPSGDAAHRQRLHPRCAAVPHDEAD